MLGTSGYKAPEMNYKLAANCLVFEHRVVIPNSLRSAILKDLHTAHLGIVKMKGLARSFIFWPGMDADIERIAQECNECAKYAHAQPAFKDHHWEYPKGPWERIHIDYAGPFAGAMLLIVVDAYSKWVEVKVTNSMTASATISILDELFAAYGIPVTLVSDNGTNFTSLEFKTFLQTVGVKFHKLTAPYHPSTNGQAERYVQTVKDKLKTMATTRGSLQPNVNEFLRQYRKAPHSATGQSPAQLFLGRSLRTRLDLLRPENLYTKMAEKHQATFNPTFREFYSTQPVFFLSGNPRMDKWIPGSITQRLGDLHYEIDYQGRSFKRHIDQIRRRFTRMDQSTNQKQKIDEPRKIRLGDDNTTQVPAANRTPLVNGSPRPITQEPVAAPVPRAPYRTDSQPRERRAPEIPRDQLAAAPQVPDRTNLTVNPYETTPRRSTRLRKPKIIFSP